MQKKIIERKPLLDEKGKITEAGYATSLILDYDRKAIKAGKTRIKEWDYYLITDGKKGLALTIADNSYMGLDSISWLDFENGWEQTTSPMRIFPMGKTGFPSTSKIGDVEIEGKNYYISFKNDGTKRVVSFVMDNFMDGKTIRGEVTLENSDDTIVVSIPFPEKETAFYYNQKINNLPATGYVELDGERYEFSPEVAFGCLDWGRGVWTYKNTWYWGSASGMLEGKPFGFNIGYGFGDTSAASENMVFFNGQSHKLSQVKFNIPTDENGKDDFMSPWTFTSDDGRFEMDFEPVLDRASETDVKIICSLQHQVFGKFTGKVTLDDGTVLEVKDFFGFAEKVFNKW